MRPHSDNKLREKMIRSLVVSLTCQQLPAQRNLRAPQSHSGRVQGFYAVAKEDRATFGTDEILANHSPLRENFIRAKSGAILFRHSVKTLNSTRMALRSAKIPLGGKLLTRERHDQGTDHLLAELVIGMRTHPPIAETEADVVLPVVLHST